MRSEIHETGTELDRCRVHLRHVSPFRVSLSHDGLGPRCDTARGLLAIVDFERIVGISDPWVLGHVRAGKGTVSDEIIDSGFELVEDVDLLDEQYVLRFKKREMAR